MQDDQHELIDVHAHFVTDDYVRAAREAGHVSPDGMPGWPTWNAADHLRFMDRQDIRRAILSISSPGVFFGDGAQTRELATSVNNAAADHVAAHPERFGFFAALPIPDIDAAVAELRRGLDVGAEGAILETNIDGHYLGDPLFEPVYAELDRRGAILFVHPTTPAGGPQSALGRPRPMLEFMFETTRSITDLVLAGITARYPSMRIVVPHAGAALPILSDRIELFQGLFNEGGGELDWGESFRGLWFDMAGTPFPTQVPVLSASVGTDHLVYGSDYCWTPDAAVDAQIASIDAAEPPKNAPSWRHLTTRNARRLLAEQAAPSAES